MEYRGKKEKCVARKASEKSQATKGLTWLFTGSGGRGGGRGCWLDIGKGVVGGGRGGVGAWGGDRLMAALTRGEGGHSLPF